MSFYDDASLVFLPSGGAGKDGKAYSIKPVPEYGTELVTNGGFDTDSNWEKGTGWSISGGVASVISTADQQLRQYIPIVSGKTYRLKFDILSLQQGAFRIFLRDGGNPSYFLTDGQGNVVNFSSPQSVNITFTATQDNDKICIYPTGTTTGSVDNVSLKEVTTQSGDFTFSRGSNLTATRVDSNGLIEKGRENLLLQSNQFDTTWTRSNASLTSGQSGYDGSNDAWLLENISGSAAYVLQSKVVNGVQTASVYAKSGNVDYIYLRLGGSSSRGLFVNLSNGTIDSTFGSLIDYNVDSVGNGWYRISVTYEGNHSNFRIYPSASGGTSTSLGDNIYIQDAQLEQGLVATEYIESGASTGLAGILEDSPRFDYSGGASCGSLLLEPSRTNLIGYSEYLDGWIKNSSPIVTQNYGISPEGVQNSTLFETTSATGRVVYDVFTINANETFSVYIKGSGPIKVQVGLDNFYPSVTSEWVRYEFKTTQVGSNGTIQIRDADNGLEASVELYGAQYERNDYATSYIPNHSGGSVTRAADTCSGAGDASTFNDDEGVLYAEIAALANDGGIRYLSLSDGGSNNRVVILFDSAADRIRAIVSSGGVKYFDENTESYDVLNYNKIAVRYKQDDFSLWVNGTNVASVSIGSSPIGLNELSYNLGGSNTIFSKSKQLIVFNTALSTTDCEILTGATAYESFSAMATALNYTTYE